MAFTCVLSAPPGACCRPRGNGGCERTFERVPRGEHERVVARAARSWTDAGRPSSAGPQGAERGRADRVERHVKLYHPVADRRVARAAAARQRQRRRQQQVDAGHSLGDPLAVVLARAAARSPSASVTRAALELRGDVRAVGVACSAQRPPWTRRPRAGSARRRRRRAGSRAGAAREQRGRRLDAVADQRLGALGPRDADLHRRAPERAPARTRPERAQHPLAAATSRAIGPAWSQLGASGKQPRARRARRSA